MSNVFLKSAIWTSSISFVVLSVICYFMAPFSKLKWPFLGAFKASLNVGFKTMIVIMELNKILSKLIKEKIREIKIMMQRARGLRGLKIGSNFVYNP